MGCGVLGGLLTTIFTAGGLPINESVFGILTDVKLLELSNADLPVLGPIGPARAGHEPALARRRPTGRGRLPRRRGEPSARAHRRALPRHRQDGRARLVRREPDGREPARPPAARRRARASSRATSPTASSSPRRSASRSRFPISSRSITARARSTSSSARRRRRPRRGEEVDEAEFRYPGPKPQFKESAIMMIADSCEAAARSLAQPNPENITHHRHQDR